MISGNKFEVHLENFTGPFDLLLTLISNKKLDLTEVALAKVVDEYLEYIKDFNERSTIEEIEDITNFLIIGATLLNFKSNLLLPKSNSLDVEALKFLEAKDLLFARLLQYKAFKEIAENFAARMINAKFGYPSCVVKEKELMNIKPELQLNINITDLAKLAATVLNRKPAEIALTHIHESHITVATQINKITNLLRIAPGNVIYFSKVLVGCETLLEVVVSFMGLLELYHQQAIKLEQSAPFAELKISLLAPKEKLEL